MCVCVCSSGPKKQGNKTVDELWGCGFFSSPARIDEEYIQNLWILSCLCLYQISYGLVATIQICLAICSRFYGIVDIVLHVVMSY